MKKNRHFRTLVCLLVGLVVLTGSAYANYDNANGYNMYKNGMKKMLEVENFSAKAELILEYNGVQMERGAIEYKYDRQGNPSQYSRETDTDGSYYEQWIQDGRRIWGNNGSYYVGYSSRSKGFNDDYLSASKEDREMIDKVINFSELFADTFVGDLKNNFVNSGSEDGQMSYQINLQGQQIPALVNAGLGLMFGSVNYAMYDFDPYLIEFEDYNIYDDENDDLYWEYYEKGEALLEQNGDKGVAYVRKDGTVEYYTTIEGYIAAVGSSSGSDYSMLDGEAIFSMLGSEPSIESANCYVTFDKEGRILENKIDGTLSGYDQDGNKHSFTLRINVELYDYGTTKIDPVDTSGMDLDTEDFQWFTYDDDGIVDFEADSYELEAGEADLADDGDDADTASADGEDEERDA